MTPCNEVTYEHFNGLLDQLYADSEEYKEMRERQRQNPVDTDVVLVTWEKP